jgi:hypothetical protein
LSGNSNPAIAGKNLGRQRKVAVFASTHRQTRDAERIDCAFQVEEVESSLGLRSPIVRTRRISPNEDSKAAFF